MNGKSRNGATTWRNSIAVGMEVASRQLARVSCRGFVVAAIASLSQLPVYSAPATALFVIDQSQSTLEVTLWRSIFSDSDTSALSGTINATVDFGSTGALATSGTLTIENAIVRAMSDFNFTLGFRPFFFADIVASGMVADINTTNPPGEMSKPTVAGTTYQFDASQYPFIMREGMINVSGSFSGSANLAEEDPPISGVSPPGTMGSLSLVEDHVSGPYRFFVATLNLPVFVDQTVMFGDPGEEEEVDMTLDATIVAVAGFYAAIDPIPGDFNSDGRVNGADYGAWKGGFGTASGATLAQGDGDGDGDVDGADFLVWQRNVGTAPPPNDFATPVPEPSGIALATGTLALLMAGRRRG